MFGFFAWFVFDGFLFLLSAFLLPPAFDRAFLTASSIPLLEYVAPETVSTLLSAFPKIFDITALALPKYGLSSLCESISTFVIEPFDIVTLTLIGPLNPWPEPV